MRPDMAKVIVERPRKGSRNPNYIKSRKGYKKRLQKEGLDFIQKESMAKNRQFGYDSKELNEHLTPLRRYLLKQVGRKWDDIFSEICENISVNSAVQSHVRDHVFDYVQNNVVVKEGKYYVIFLGKELRPLESDWKILYVDPITGILRKNKQKKIKYSSKELGVRLNGKVYIRLNEIWYEVLLKQGYVEKYTYISPMTGTKIHYERWVGSDIIFGADYGNCHYRYPSHWGNKCYAVDKRQLNKKEIKNLGLRKYDKEEWANITIIRKNNRIVEIKRGIHELG